jgi:small subunit ribosomal protein S2
MEEVSLKELLEAGCHFGHQTTRWHPKMKEYIYTARDGIHIFDLVKTKKGLEEAAEKLREIASKGGKIIFVGTKRQAQDIVKEAAEKVGMPYITERWVGGLITNWDQIKKRIDRLADLKAGKTEERFKNRTKKERILIDKEIVKLERSFGGISGLKGIPEAIFVTDARKDDGALKEAKGRGVTTVAIVDTNVDPGNVDYVIPANDDASKSLQLIVDTIRKAIEEGIKNQVTKSEKEAEPKKETKKVEKAPEKEEKEGKKVSKVKKESVKEVVKAA